MKFIDNVCFKVWQLETDNGIFYRTNDSGDNWERLYGESWEPVYLTEEEECKKAWQEHFGIEE